ncbi:MAG: AAA family ATPase [Dethiosulfatibacter sp.]|nr:AAA family ATPase [Dethiosulfatibacter sp.]
MSKFTLVTSCNGKQGKTILAIEIARKLATKHKVLFVDMSKSSKSAAAYLGNDENIIYDFVDLMTGMCSVEEATIKPHNDKHLFDLIPAPRLRNKIIRDSKMFEKFFLMFSKSYDYVIIDGIDLYLDDVYYDYDGLDKIIFITEGKVEDLRKINTCIQKIGKENIENLLTVINKYSKTEMLKGRMYNQKELDEMMQINIIGELGYNSNYESIEVMNDQTDQVLKNFEEIAVKIVEKL